jgi:ketosteroid isomerase-like protein
MSQENVEIVRCAFNAIGRGDEQYIESAFHADAVWHNTAEFPGPATCVGPQAIVDFWEALQDSFGESEMDIERIMDGNETVVVSVHSVSRGRASGAPIDLRWAAAVQVRDGKIRRVDIHGDWTKALKAVGLEE